LTFLPVTGTICAMSAEISHTPKVELVDTAEDAGKITHTLQAETGRTLAVEVFVGDNYPIRLAGTYISNADETHRAPGVTTALYQEALHVIKGEAERVGGNILYSFETSNPEMAGWADDPTKGRGIFGWDRERVSPDGQKTTYTKTIRPE
jgi:hypothetical protein